jgi:predicted ATPase
MRLLTLTINRFKNLNDVTIEFAAASDTYVILGGNGTGKSNLIEALVAIFADVDLRRKPAFGYELVYECRGKVVCISGSVGDSFPTVLLEKEKQFLPEPGQSIPVYMPDHIIAYYSGPGSRLESHFSDHMKREHDMLRDPVKDTYSPFIYCQAQYSDFLLLACFATGAFNIREFVSGRLGIRRIESVHFDLLKPRLSPTRSRQIADEDGDKRFWNATGEAAYILDLLWNKALAPYKDQGESSNKRGPSKSEHLYLFLKDQDALREAARPFGPSYGFFRHLCYLQTLGMVNEVTILLHRRGCDAPFSFSDFSEGERQLLTIVGLLNMVEGGENLILLDEPDTHLNPNWKYEYLSILRPNVEKHDRNQLIITTHDPLMIGELHKEQVYLFRRDNEQRRVIVEHPKEDPIGQGVAGLLKSELFGLRSTIDATTIEKIDKRYKLYAKGEDRTPEDTAEMHRLIGELSKNGFTTDFRDPYYEQFAKALARRPEFMKPQLTADELEDQEQLADDILNEILGADS